MACPAVCVWGFKNVFLVYGGAAFALLFMTYSSSSVHDEIM